MSSNLPINDSQENVENQNQESDLNSRINWYSPVLDPSFEQNTTTPSNNSNESSASIADLVLNEYGLNPNAQEFVPPNRFRSNHFYMINGYPSVIPPRITPIDEPEEEVNNESMSGYRIVIPNNIPPILEYPDSIPDLEDNANPEAESEDTNEVDDLSMIPPQIRDLIRLHGQQNFIIGNQDLELENLIYNIINPQCPSVEPNYLIEKFNQHELGICEIDYPFEGTTVKVFVPTIVALDNPFFNRLINSQIINFKDILKEKEAAIHIAYFIKTGEVTPEVQPHHDELSGYSKKPLSEECIGNLKFKDIKETELLDSLEDSSNCSICQAQIKDLIEDDTEVVVLECGDYFCKDCIFKWLENYQNKCPNCNKVLASKEEEEKPRMTSRFFINNNFYKAAFFIIRYCSYYLQKSEINVQRLNQLNELYIQQAGLVSMNDCKSLLDF